MGNFRSSLHLSGRKEGFQVLDDVLPSECREAHGANLIYIHDLKRFFEPEVSFVGLSLQGMETGDKILEPLMLFRQLFRSARNAVGVCVPHFDEDMGEAPLSSLTQTREVLRTIFAMLHEFSSQTPFTLNVGSSFSQDGRRVTAALLSLLDEGPTLTQPFVVMRVRRGQNLHENDPHHDLLRRALELARHRQGIAFSLMDSTLNAQWLDAVAYTSKGYRVDPMTGDFLRGTREHHIVGSVSINLPLLVSESDREMERVLRLAARVLAQRQELIATTYNTYEVPGPQVLNLVGLSKCYPDDPLAAFSLLEKLAVWVTRLRREYGLEYLLAGTEARRQDSLSVEAEQQYLLRGGHCLVRPAGPHLSVDELYADLLAAFQAGISFLRYSVDDVRCLLCHTTVAAMGPCPLCGCPERREVLYDDGVLVGGVKHEGYQESASLR